MADSELNAFAGYVFPAIRGIQANREYYVIMCPLGLVPHLFVFQEKEVRPELRRQRILNKARIPVIARYIVENRESYVLSALTASADMKVDFHPASNGWPGCNSGTIQIPANKKLLLNDGQHRKAAIEQALKECPDLADESIAVVLFLDEGLRRSQQMFADLNKHAVKPSRSLSVLFDHRDPLARLSLRIMNDVPLFAHRIEVESSTISNRSQNLFTLSALHRALGLLLNYSGQAGKLTEDDYQFARDFWNQVCENIPEWKLLIRNEVTAAVLRKSYIHAHGVGLQAIARVGASLRHAYPYNWNKKLSKLSEIDWSRSNVALWEGRAMLGGRMSGGPQNVILTANAIKIKVGLELSEEESRAEFALRLSREAESHG